MKKLLDCGHPEDAGHPANVQNKDGHYETVQGWKWSYSLDGKRKLCHACKSKEILDCGHPIGEHSYFTGGYGEDATGRKICYACCGTADKADMTKTGKTVLYLSKHTTERELSGTRDGAPQSYKVTTWTVGNWPGTLKFAAYVNTGRHNIAGRRYDAYFTGPDGYKWHGVTYGDNSQLCHCKRTKTKRQAAA